MHNVNIRVINCVDEFSFEPYNLSYSIERLGRLNCIDFAADWGI